jgi:hypothetical protein
MFKNHNDQMTAIRLSALSYGYKWLMQEIAKLGNS